MLKDGPHQHTQTHITIHWLAEESLPRTDTYAHIHVVCTQMHTNTHICTHIHTYICTHTYVCTCTYAYAHIHVVRGEGRWRGESLPRMDHDSIPRHTHN